MIAPLALRLLEEIGVDIAQHTGHDIACHSPIDGHHIITLHAQNAEQVRHQVAQSQQAFLEWRMLPAPRRGELVRLFGNELRSHKLQLGTLVSLETGKILQEGLGEVQEMIDICDFAVGLSRQLYGLQIASERPMHRMMETWHPLGVVGIISAFNFPVAVWAWNAAIALVSGNSVVWKPSEKTPLTALAAHHLLSQAIQQFGKDAPSGLSEIVLGGASVSQIMIEHPSIKLVSATGSTRMGRHVAEVCAKHFKRSLLELGGNNAMIVTPSGNLDLALRAITFSAVGTAGQRCTSLRRLFLHESIADQVIASLKDIYRQLRIGNPLNEQVLVGPLIDRAAFEAMQHALDQACVEQGMLFGGDRIHIDHTDNAYYVQPAIVEMPAQSAVMQHETFAPILYVMRYRDLDLAIALNNGVNQGLSSCIFTNDLRESELFLSACGSDCGIANVNIGPSGAEIGGAFGGEKETGGGRESGSDAWKNYMRRCTNTINYGHSLPLAQGIHFAI